jgi:mannonate dehydratase
MKTDRTDDLRRRILKSALAAAAGGGGVFGPFAGSEPRAAAKLDPLPAGIKLSLQIPTEFADEDLTFAKQIGADHVSVPGNAKTATYDNFVAIKTRVEAAGLKVWNIGNASVHNMEEVTLGLAGRDHKIEEYKQFLRNLGRAGLKYTTYAHMGNGIWSSARETTRGGAPARALDMSKEPVGRWNGKEFKGPLTHGRAYTPEEIWDNYKYFIKRVVPVAEEVGIRIGIHPDDPPVPVLGGVPRCVFGNFEGYVKALEIANSPNIGVCLCCGTWLEGGKGMGKDVAEAAEYFGRKGKLWKIHFRNVSAPLPHFVETFPDDGYYDMYRIMRVLKKVDFRGAIIADHVPGVAGSSGNRAGWAYCFGYMRGLLQRATAELAGR